MLFSENFLKVLLKNNIFDQKQFSDTLAPKRKEVIVRNVLRSLIAGLFVSILNACIAG